MKSFSAMLASAAALVLCGSIGSAQEPRRGPGLAEAAATRFVDIEGAGIAYREIGAGQPLVLLHRFRASMDDWDPAFLDALVVRRRVIAFDNTGVGQSTGETPASLEAQADNAACFMRAIGIEAADVLGWSMGGMTAPILAIRHPEMVRRLVLAGTMPPAGSPEVVPAPQSWLQVVTKPTYTDDDHLFAFYTDTPASIAAGRASIARLSRPGQPATAIKTSAASMQAMLAASRDFISNRGGWYEQLKSIRHPTLVANGDRDRAFPVIDSVILAREIPNAQLAIYPDAGHGFLFQHSDRFAADVLRFSTLRRPRLGECAPVGRHEG